MGNIPVATNNDFAAAVGQLAQVLEEVVHEDILHILSMVAAGARWQIHRNDGELVIHQLQVAAFSINFDHAQAFDDLLGLVPGVNADAAVALAFGIVKIALVTGGVAHVFSQVGVLRLQFLHADEVGILRGQPLQKAFSDGGADAVKIDGNYAKHSG